MRGAHVHASRSPARSAAWRTRGGVTMNLVVFGLTVSSSWGNGHATPWRGLCRALAARGHEVTFFERDVPYYAAHRDAPSPAGCDLRLYRDWQDIVGDAQRLADQADVAMITSYCPDA